MEIVISGNKESFQLTRAIAPIEIRFIAPNFAQPDSVFTVSYNGYQLDINANDFYRLSETIKGKAPIDVHFALSKIIQDTYFSNSFLSKSLTEVSLFKTLFLIYYWVEIAFTDAYAVSIASKIYDEFIVDYNSQLGSQQDIYFIKHELITSQNMPYIDRLIQINLLAKVSLVGGVFGKNDSYFIPLIKPGVSREFFSNNSDPSGDKTFSFWKKILEDRDARLNSWMKNRF